jgi:hypothetical protein
MDRYRYNKMSSTQELGALGAMSTLDPKLDGERLARQLDRVREYMLTRCPYNPWRTLGEMREYLWLTYGQIASEAGISARLRDLRREGLIVDRRRRTRGQFEYSVSKAASKAEEFKLTA